MPNKISTPATQKDIAKALGFAQSTVAWALSSKNEHRLPAETVELIRKKAQQLNYIPQHQARILRTGQSHIIGLFLHSTRYHAPAERTRSLARAAIRAGYQIVAVDMDWFDGDFRAALIHMLGLSVDGIVFCNLQSHLSEEWESAIAQRRIPLVSMGNHGILPDETDVDLHSIFHEMVLHHLAQGSRHLHLLLPFHDGSQKEVSPGSFLDAWVCGFRQAIESVNGEVVTDEANAALFGLRTKFPPGKKGIRGQIHYPLKTDLYSDVLDVGYHQTRHLLKTTDVDSLICSNDDVAAGAITACFEAGARIPEEVLVSGGDNSVTSRYCGIPLTTIGHPFNEQAQWSIRRIIDLIESPEERKQPKSKLFPCQIIQRRSTLRCR